MNRPVNLLPVSIRKRFEHRRQARLWGVAWILAVILLAGAQSWLDSRRREAARDLEAAEAKTEPLREAKAITRRLLREIETRKVLVYASRNLEQRDTPLALLQMISECCRELDGSVRLESLSIDETASNRRDDTTLPTKAVRIVGTADADVRVAAFVSLLRRSGAFHQVQLEGSQAQSERDESRRSFQIRCEQRTQSS